MKHILISLLFLPFYSVAQCIWTQEFAIPNNHRLTFQECQAEKRIRVNNIDIQPNIEFEIVHQHYPEGNSIWSSHSPDDKSALVWIENSKFERNLWVLDLLKNEVVYSLSSIAEGRHFTASFRSNDTFVVNIGGMGYRKEFLHAKRKGNWESIRTYENNSKKQRDF